MLTRGTPLTRPSPACEIMGMRWQSPSGTTNRETHVYIGQPYIRLGGVAYPTPTVPRSGLSATFGVQVFALAGTGPTVEITVEHKNEEDTSFTTAGTFASISSTGVHTLDVSSLKEQIRLVVVIGGSSTTNMAYDRRERHGCSQDEVTGPQIRRGEGAVAWL